MKTTIKVQNLKCEGCANTISKKLHTIESISNVEVDVEKSLVEISYENEGIIETIKSTLNSLGYPEEGESNTFGNKAKSYVSCAIGKIDL